MYHVTCNDYQTCIMLHTMTTYTHVSRYIQCLPHMYYATYNDNTYTCITLHAMTIKHVLCYIQ